MSCCCCCQCPNPLLRYAAVGAAEGGQLCLAVLLLFPISDASEAHKQEEDKKLLEQNQDDYSASVWSDPKALKSSFNGMGSVSWRPT